jgi:hypothetical protein
MVKIRSKNAESRMPMYSESISLSRGMIVLPKIETRRALACRRLHGHSRVDIRPSPALSTLDFSNTASFTLSLLSQREHVMHQGNIVFSSGFKRHHVPWRDVRDTIVYGLRR